MCGRYTQMRPWSELVELYRITADLPPPNLPPRYNIAPTQTVPIVRRSGEASGRNGGREDGGREDGGREDGGREDGGRELVLVRWGL
ncbi:MAG TPA: SOS response-associated peptidase family protein, partial [Rhodospirillales bacterium]|nr:SOS response-associated peptidase family protein [Rhodospirillales bacterium]